MISSVTGRRRPNGADDGAGGLPFEQLYPAHRATGILQSSYAPPRAVAATLVSTILAPANPARRSLTIVNDGTANLYVNRAGFASTSSFAVKLSAGATFVLEPPDAYAGDVAGVWDAVNGSARITETTG
jgi:hypothetical protein